jgi:DNA polymerase IV
LYSTIAVKQATILDAPTPFPHADSDVIAPDLRVMMIDFNAYFASVEQQLNPSLRGRPVGVVPMKAETTCCIAASYEAKAFGVKTGTRVSDARLMCPGIVFVVAVHAKYVTMHHRAVAIVDSLIPVDEVLSIDEMCCTLTPRWQTPAAARQLALSIKHALIKDLGECMKTSIGIGSNRFLAKTASNLKKPDGLVLLRAGDMPAAVAHWQIEDLNGIGRNMGIRLRHYGIDTIDALYAQTRQQLRTVWGGVGGEVFWQRLHGLEVATPPTQTQTLGHSHVLPPNERHRAGAIQVLDRLMQKAAMRLRKGQWCTTGMSVFVSMMRDKATALGKRPYWEASARLPETDDTRVLLHTLKTLLKRWDAAPSGSPQAQAAMPQTSLAKPLKVGLVLHGLIPKRHITLSLFDDVQQVQETHKLNDTLDALNLRFGKNTLYYATAHGALDAAPMRIAFNRIPDLETER